MSDRYVASMDPEPMTVAVIPAFRARATLRGVVAKALDVVDMVVVVDDACPEACGDTVRGMDSRVLVIRHERNRGVGGATKTGIAHALELGATYVVKIDADG
ncbi:MAG: glycosyltransferase, partial [Candidatus Eremiobacteraeota bacterium]|nr:glycosyltransferase [Candidatus Eremiobacteraeota bacterium]